MSAKSTWYENSPPQTPTLNFLWRVTAFGRDRQLPGTHYWYENKDRTPKDMVVFQYTANGELTYRDAEGMHPVPKGHALLFGYAEDTGYGLSEDAQHIYESRFVCLRGEGLAEHWNAIRRLYGSIHDLTHAPSILETMARLTDRARPHHAASPSAQASLVFSLVMQLFDVARASHTQELCPVERAVAAVRDTPLTVWSLKEVAATYGVSREHLTRVFHDQTGHTPAAYIRRACLQRALWLIENTRLSITEIAHQAGYSSTHTLARHVREATGHSPQALRVRADDSHGGRS